MPIAKLTSYIISDHAYERFAERCNDPSTSLLDELSLSAPVGAQKGSGFARYLPCGLVAVGEHENGLAIIKTILTRDQSIANMQSRRMAIATPAVRNPTVITKQKKGKKSKAIKATEAESIQLLPPPQTPKLQTKYERLLDCNLPDYLKNSGDDISAAINRINPQRVLNKITHLAAWHAIRSTPRKQRNKDLIECQIAFDSLEHAEYRHAYAGAKLARDTIKTMLFHCELSPGQIALIQKIFDSWNEIQQEQDEENLENS